MKPMRAGLVSTIIPVRNRPVLLAEAVASVVAQTHRPIEIIVIDDGSTDATLDAARALEIAHPGVVRVITQDARGVASARNAGLDAASGEFVQFLDSDDLLMPAKFARQVEALAARRECGISYCMTREYKIGGRWSGLPARRTGDTLNYLFPALLMGRVWAAPSPLYRREVIEQNGPMEELAIYEDWDYEARAGSRNVPLHHCAEYLADKRDTHHLVGGQKGGTRRHKLQDFARIHHRVHRYGVAAGVSAGDLDRFAAKVAAAARACAAEGFDAEARGLVDLAGRVAQRRTRRALVALYRLASNQLGWSPVARALTAIDRSPAFDSARALGRWPRAAFLRWRHRAQAARGATAGKTITEWPRVLAVRWADRSSRHRVP